MTILAIPDIHGNKAELDRVLRLADATAGPEARIVFLGDLVDRGPDSRGVIQTLIDGIAAGRDWIVLRGNHDQIFLDALSGTLSDGEDLRPGSGWLTEVMGGRETLASYGIDAFYGAVRHADLLDQVPPDHLRFLQDRPHSVETETLFFAHAGILPGVPFADQSPRDLTWIREPFLSDRRDHGKLVVHGHTAIKRPAHYGNRVNLDGGAGWGRPLALALFEGQDCWLVSENGRMPLTP